MASVNDNDIKLENWLHIITFDITKYVKAGGAVVVGEADGALTVTFADVAPDDDRLHRRFLKLATEQAEAPAPQPVAAD